MGARASDIYLGDGSEWLLLVPMIIAMYLGKYLSASFNNFLKDNYATICGAGAFFITVFVTANFFGALLVAAVAWYAGLIGSMGFERRDVEEKNTLNKIDTLSQHVASNTASKKSYDNSDYQSFEVNHAVNSDISKSSSAKQQTESLASEQKKNNFNEPLVQGNLRCCGCGYQNIPKNFLPSDVGELYRKCPECSMNWQVLYASNAHGKYRCLGCGLIGDKGAFSQVRQVKTMYFAQNVTLTSHDLDAGNLSSSVFTKIFGCY